MPVPDPTVDELVAIASSLRLCRRLLWKAKGICAIFRWVEDAPWQPNRKCTVYGWQRQIVIHL